MDGKNIFKFYMILNRRFIMDIKKPEIVYHHFFLLKNSDLKTD